MATMTDKPYTVVALEDGEWGPAIAPGAGDTGRVRKGIRRDLGITSFGINAFRAPAGEDVIREHDEAGFVASGQEELYLVLSGAATFEVDGESFEAAAGSLVFVRDPAAKRSAVAKDAETTILVIGGTPGEAYDPGPVEVGEALAAYNAGDYETAVAKQLIVVEKRPNNVLALFNAGCFEARLGRTDDAIGHLEQAVEADDRIKELIRTDEDLDSLREDPRFVVLAK
jgi:mannose-6-phosphate isomerase-like protein (cupin superfamily)